MHKIILLLLIPLLLLSCRRLNSTSFHAVVDAGYMGTAGEMISGSAKYSTIGEALAVVPENNSKPFIILIREGHYYEKLSVDKPNVHIIGENRDRTIITFDTHGDTPSPDGGRYGTWGSFTLRITAVGFYAENLTIENGFDYPANAVKSDDDPTKVQNAQAVALMTAEGSDKAVFRNCVILGYQDTLFANAGRQIYINCQIYGHVDFIFGAGQAVFDQCDIISRNRKNKSTTGYITAPSTPIDYPYGFLFVDCRLLRETLDLPAGNVRLGRPWHPSGNLRVSGSAVFMNCEMDDHISPEGYARISSRNSEGDRIWFDIEPDSRFFEFHNTGPGAFDSSNRPKLDENAAVWYMATNVLNGWNP
ncbi:pectinesterase A [candidate division KSB1 bacterium]|nr:pectinesterase A [candidate division KSB1 bacterium]